MQRRNRNDDSVVIIPAILSTQHYTDDNTGPNETSIHTIYESPTLLIRGVYLGRQSKFSSVTPFHSRLGESDVSGIRTSTLIYVVHDDVQISLYDRTSATSDPNLNISPHSQILRAGSFFFINNYAHFVLSNIIHHNAYSYNLARFLVIERKSSVWEIQNEFERNANADNKYIPDILHVLTREDETRPLSSTYYCKLINEDHIASTTGCYYLHGPGLHFNCSHAHEYVFLNLIYFRGSITTGGPVRQIEPHSIIIARPNSQFSIIGNSPYNEGFVFINYDNTKTLPLSKRNEIEKYNSVVMNEDHYTIVDSRRMIDRQPYKLLSEYRPIEDYMISQSD